MVGDTHTACVCMRMVAIVDMHALDQMTKLRKNKEQDEKKLQREPSVQKKKKSVRTRSAVVGSLPMFEIFLDVS